MTLSLVLATSLYLPASAVTAQQPNVVYVLADQWRASATGYAGNPTSILPPRPFSQALLELPQRHLGGSGVHALSRGSDHGAISDSRRACSSTTPICRTTSYAWQRCIGLPLRDRIHRQVASRRPWARLLYPAREAARLGLLESSRVRSQLQPFALLHRRVGQKRFWEGYDVFAQTKDTQRYLRERASGEQPFLLFLSYGTPHFPHDTAPAEFKAIYPPEDIQLSPNVPPDMQVLARKKRRATTRIARRWTGASANYWRRWKKLDSQPTRLLFSLPTTVKCWDRTEHIPTSSRWPGTSPRTCRSCCVIRQCTASTGARSARR